ncbi:hypothetical protein EVJ58_g9569 [Rhodofomes roseus]|uniref:Uncharacterized protein n=1 Tax=Rhodofomes roseus TaxID=34475 RepID=A0A4Y9XV20_9APHY|nr:hypothetical protein EVJ58_g9569 [Rhodofomes roseus]
MSNERDKLHIPLFPESQQLNRTNWMEWKTRISTILRLKGLLGYLDGTTPIPSAAAGTTAIEKWRKNDDLVKGIITLNMTDLSGRGADPDTMNAHEFWSALLAVRERRSELAVLNAEEYLKACKYVPGSDVHAHFDEMRRRRKACRDLGSTMMTDQRFAIIICLSMMGETLRPVIIPLLTRTDPEDVMSTILVVYDELLQLGLPQNPFRDTRSGTGALAVEKTSAFMTAAKATVICAWCGWKNHTKETCYCAGGGKAGQQPSHWKSQPRPKKGSPADLSMHALRASIFSQSINDPSPTQRLSRPSVCVATVPPAETQAPIDSKYQIFLAT